MTENKLIVHLLKEEVVRRGWSNREAAERLGVAPSAFGYWMSGERRPSRRQYGAICDLLPTKVLVQLAREFGLPEEASDAAKERFRQFWMKQPELLGDVDYAFANTPEARILVEAKRREKAARDRGEANPHGVGLLGEQESEGYKVKPIRENELARVPVMSIARAAGFMPAIHGTASDFIDELGNGDFEEWRHLPKDHLLLRIDGNSMAPVLNHGSVVEIDTTRAPRSKEMVVAMISTEEAPVVKYYLRKDYTVHLRSVNTDPDEGLHYRFDLKKPSEEHLVWVHPVVRIQTEPMSADDLDWSHIE